MPNHWILCKNRAASMCVYFGLTASTHHGNGRMGVSYSITFWYQDSYFHELRDRSPSRLFDKLSAFDWGLTCAEKFGKSE